MCICWQLYACEHLTMCSSHSNQSPPYFPTEYYFCWFLNTNYLLWDLNTSFIIYTCDTLRISIVYKTFCAFSWNTVYWIYTGTSFLGYRIIGHTSLQLSWGYTTNNTLSKFAHWLLLSTQGILFNSHCTKVHVPYTWSQVLTFCFGFHCYQRWIRSKSLSILSSYNKHILGIW